MGELVRYVKRGIEALSRFIGKANSEADGSPSNMRVIVFYSFLILIPCVAFVLVYVTVVIKQETLIIAVLTLVIGFLGTLLGIKKSQKKNEETTTKQ